MTKKRKPKIFCPGCHLPKCHGECMANAAPYPNAQSHPNGILHECDRFSLYSALVGGWAIALILYIVIIVDYIHFSEKFDAIPSPHETIRYVRIGNVEALSECQGEWKSLLARNKRLQKFNLELRTANASCIERFPQ